MERLSNSISSLTTNADSNIQGLTTLSQIMKNRPRVMIILRGLPGSGKSTLSKLLLSQGESGVACGADDFFETEGGGYEFDKKLLPKAHQWAQERIRQNCQLGFSLVIVDNTHSQCWEAKEYVRIGLSYKYEVEIVEVTTPWARDVKELAKKNSHDVPLLSIERMLRRWEDPFTIDSILSSQSPDWMEKKQDDMYHSFSKQRKQDPKTSTYKVSSRHHNEKGKKNSQVKKKPQKPKNLANINPFAALQSLE